MSAARALVARAVPEAGARLGGLRRVAAAAALVLAAPAWAGSWVFVTDEPLLLGGTVNGSFSGVDSNADAVLTADELSFFSVGYVGAPPATSSFAIGKPLLDATDSFTFDVAAGSLSFEVFGNGGVSISGGSFAFTSVVGEGFVDAGGTLRVTPVPEPGAAALMLAGLALIAVARRPRNAVSGVGEQAA